MSRIYDAIAIGCGPAGSLAAWHMARAGLRVLLLDKQTFPRTKPCGGGLSAKALDLLPYDVSEVVHRWMDGARIRVAGRADIALNRQALGAMVERSEFDAFMLQRARDAGAAVVTGASLVSLSDSGSKIRVETSAGTFDAARVIGADGATSAVRRLLFPACWSRRAFALEAKIRFSRRTNAEALQPSSHARFDFATMRGGYGWAFPKRDHVNVGVYRLRKPGRDAGLQRHLHRFLGELGGSRDDIIGSIVGHSVPLSDGAQPLARGRAILVGDAAGLGEAFFGEGIAFALQSGTIGARWAIATLDCKECDPAPAYADAIRPLVTRLKRSRFAAGALYEVPSPWLGRLAASAPLLDVAVSFLCGGPRFSEGRAASGWRESARPGAGAPQGPIAMSSTS